MIPDDIVIIAAARTPQGRLKGQLAPLTAVQLGATAIRGALERGGVPAHAVDAVLVGQVLPAGAGQNPARQAAIAAGIGWDVHAASVNKVCLSGLTAVIDGVDTLMDADSEAFKRLPDAIDAGFAWHDGPYTGTALHRVRDGDA